MRGVSVQVTRVSEPIILIQRLVTIWTKKSRGAPGSIRRNAVPDAIVLPVNRFAGTRFTLLEHDVIFHERSEFENPQEKSSVFDSLGQQGRKKFGCVEVSKTDGGLQVSWSYDSRDAGLPDRARTQADSALGLNSWARVVFNGRYSMDWEGGWWYEKKVVNVGFFSTLSETVFKDSAPEITIDRMTMLY